MGRAGNSCRVGAAIDLFAFRTVFNWNDPIGICMVEIWMTSVYRQRSCRTIDRVCAVSQPQRRPEINTQLSQRQVQFNSFLHV